MGYSSVNSPDDLDRTMRKAYWGAGAVVAQYRCVDRALNWLAKPSKCHDRCYRPPDTFRCLILKMLLLGCVELWVELPQEFIGCV